MYVLWYGIKTETAMAMMNSRQSKIDKDK